MSDDDMSIGDGDDFEHQLDDCMPDELEESEEEIVMNPLHYDIWKTNRQCPDFFDGSLQDACQEAFKSKKLFERRPVVVYIHNKKDIFSNIFCEKIFCETQLIDYLNNNYIIWPWDISETKNRDKLLEIWRKMFGTELCIEQSPMLIGIMRLFDYQGIELPTTLKYQFNLLMKSDTILRTRADVLNSPKSVLFELKNFKLQCDKNEKTLLFDFLEATDLCREILLQITSYLSLNDAISAFSPRIIPLLNNYQSSFHLFEPSLLLLTLIREKFDPQKIVSLRVNAQQTWSQSEYNLLSHFQHIKSLTLLEFSNENQINQYVQYLSNDTCLSLYFCSEINFNIIVETLKTHKLRMKRLHLYGTEISFYPSGVNRIYGQGSFNYSPEYFLLDISFCSITSLGGSWLYNSLSNLINFLAQQRGIHYVTVIIHKDDIAQWLNVHQWTTLSQSQLELKKITLRTTKNLSQRKQLVKQTFDIQKTFNEIGSTTKFQIQFS